MAMHEMAAKHWWDRHEWAMWVISRSVEHWAWTMGLFLLTLFTAAS